MLLLAGGWYWWQSRQKPSPQETTQVADKSSADGAIAEIRRTKPDLVVCDLNMPGGGGLKVARSCGEETHIVMLTVSEQERDLLDAVAAGAIGYLVKTTPPDELRHDLWRAAQGEPVFSPALASLVLGEFRRKCGETTVPARMNTDLLQSHLRLLRDGDERGRAARWAGPILSLQGGDDPILPEGLRSAAFSGAADLRRVGRPDGGHLLPVTQPAWCAAQIRDLLAELA